MRHKIDIVLTSSQQDCLTQIAKQKGINKIELMSRLLHQALVALCEQEPNDNMSPLAEFWALAQDRGCSEYTCSKLLNIQLKEMHQYVTSLRRGKLVNVSRQLSQKLQEQIAWLKSLPSQQESIELLNRAIERFGPASGGTMVDVAKALGISAQRLSNWVLRPPEKLKLEIVELLSQLREQGIL